MLRKRGRSPAGLPVMVLANADRPSDDWARRLGVVLTRRSSAALLQRFVRAAHARTAQLHEELRRIAELSRLSAYETELGWRWVLGQQRERELMSVLSISKATLTERRRSVLAKTGAADPRELVSWILHGG